MTHAELFMDVSGRYRWLADEGPGQVTVSQESFPTAEHAYAAA
jgi:hypothetical protein